MIRWCHQEGVGREPCVHGLGWEEVPGDGPWAETSVLRWQLCDYLVVEENSRQGTARMQAWKVGRGM